MTANRAPSSSFDAHAARIGERDPRRQRARVPAPGGGARRGRRADAALARGEHLGPLHGVPFTVQGGDPGGRDARPNGSRLFADHVFDADAEPVRRLRDAGAILLGKTNVPEFCAHWDTYNELSGATANPHDVTRSAGGSSGGEAAALASAMTALGLGSDLQRLDPLPRPTSAACSACGPGAARSRGPIITRWSIARARG